MSDATLRIKNLSIALEALSRIGGAWPAIELHNGIARLLKIEIAEAEEEKQKPIIPKPTQLSHLDDIPF
jgi:hypothetical protein